jgi:glycosyltransferase involved in cell wall biosynthesis
MKLLVFAHTPPPHHGQSYMVQLMLEALGGDRRTARHGQPPLPGAEWGIECYHVNARLSQKLEEIGDFRVGKLILLVGYCLQAIWCRFRHGVTTFYYIPAPGKRSALYRDWLILFLCRPFFKRIILHWHASGLAKWLETVVLIRSRALTYAAAKRADLSIVLSEYGRADAEKLLPLRIAIVGNGIPDPYPQFTTELLPRRRARLQARRLLLADQVVPPELAALTGPEPDVFKVLFLGHCTRDKGLFEAVRGAILARQQLIDSSSRISLKLVVAGQFVHSEEEAEFHRLCAEEGREAVEYVGYVTGETKSSYLKQADGFCFPSHIESFGLVLVEAMAFGLPIVVTRCGAMPEVVSRDYPGLVDRGRPDQIAEALLRIMTQEDFEQLRQRFEANFTLERHVARLAAALQSVEGGQPEPIESPAPAPVTV